MLKELSPGYALTVFNADSFDMRRRGIDVSCGVTLTRTKTLIDYRPKEGRYEHSAAVSFFSIGIFRQRKRRRRSRSCCNSEAKHLAVEVFLESYRYTL